MAFQIYRGPQRSQLGAFDPQLEAVADAMKERNDRAMMLKDEERRKGEEQSRMMAQEKMVMDRQRQIHEMDNAAKLERSQLATKDQGDIDLRNQRSAIPVIQKNLGAGNLDGARAEAAKQGLDLSETPTAPPVQKRARDVSEMQTPLDVLGLNGFNFDDAQVSVPGGDGKSRYRVSVGGQDNDFELKSQGQDNSAVAATFGDYLKHSDPLISRAATALQTQVSLGKEQPGRALEKLATLEAQVRGQNVSEANSQRNSALGYGRLGLDRNKAATAVDKGDPTNDRAIRDTMASHAGVTAAIDRYDELLDEGMSLPFQELNERKTTAQGTIGLRLKDSEHMGALDAGVTDAVGRIIGSGMMSGIAPGLARAKVDEARRYLKAQFEARMNALRASKGEIRGDEQPDAAAAPAAPSSSRKVVRTGRNKAGQLIVLYSDGSKEVKR